MGDKWSRLVNDSAFVCLGTDNNANFAKVTYEAIEDSNRFILVKEVLKKH